MEQNKYSISGDTPNTDIRPGRQVYTATGSVELPNDEGLPDGSGKPGEGFAGGFAPDLQRTAGTTVDSSTDDVSPQSVFVFTKCVRRSSRRQTPFGQKFLIFTN